MLTSNIVFTSDGASLKSPEFDPPLLLLFLAHCQLFPSLSYHDGVLNKVPQDCGSLRDGKAQSQWKPSCAVCGYKIGSNKPKYGLNLSRLLKGSKETITGWKSIRFEQI